MPPTQDRSEIEKRQAAARAAGFIESGMLLGLGSGSTFEYTLMELSRRIKEENLQVKGVPSSERTRALAKQYDIPIVSFQPGMRLDLTFDGADEVDDEAVMIKGGGGALLREKIIAHFSHKVLIAVDSSKLVRRIGAFPLPVEVLPFGMTPVIEEITRLGADAAPRTSGNEPLVTDNGNFIVDCAFGDIEDGAALDRQLKQIPGVVETGIFAHLLDILVVGRSDGADVTVFDEG